MLKSEEKFDRRIDKREKIKRDTELILMDRTLHGKLIDISENGFCFSVPLKDYGYTKLTYGAEIRVRFKIHEDDEEPFTSTAFVMYEKKLKKEVHIGTVTISEAYKKLKEETS